MNKIKYIIKEMLYMVKKHRLYILIPILLALMIIALLVFYIAPAITISFIYAGV